jgi:hypothetical protein
MAPSSSPGPTPGSSCWRMREAQRTRCQLWAQREQVSKQCVKLWSEAASTRGRLGARHTAHSVMVVTGFATPLCPEYACKPDSAPAKPATSLF